MSILLPRRDTLNELLSLQRTHLMGLQISLDDTSYRVMEDGLRQALRSTRPAFARMRNAALGLAEPRMRALPPLSLPWLNDSQQMAVRKVLAAQDVAIVHGPPGTGKTTTLIEAVIETLRRETQVMVCAPSNAAVDWISTLLVRRGVGVLRIGNPLRMSDEMLECSYERKYAAHPDYAELWAIRKELHDRDRCKDKERRKKLQTKRDELEAKIKHDLFEQTRVVSCTLIGSAYRILEGQHFSTLFIDEAAQALEPACWTAMLKADRLVLSGDHQQLPPTIKNPEAARGGLERTLMEKLTRQWPLCVSLLATQYRMNRDIMAFTSHWFYHGKLVAAPGVGNRLVSPIDTPLLFVDTSLLGFGEHQGSTFSRSNADEARLLLNVLRDYIGRMTPQRIQGDAVDFGIISPYRSQVRLLRNLLKRQYFFRSLRRHISVGTVDGFQGQERDVIVISMVRSNDDGHIGFLRDLRRMNVAMTRARMKLIIVGNAETLGKHPFYHALIDYFNKKGCFITMNSMSID